MKRKISITLLTLLSLLILALKAKPVSADSTIPSYINNINNLTEEEAKQIGTVTYSDKDITVISFGDNKEISDAINRSSSSKESNLVQRNSGFIPRTTVTSNRGYARLNVGKYSKRRALYWAVNTDFPMYNFEGSILLRYYSGYSKDIGVRGNSATGTYVSGSIYINRGNGGKATLVGGAVGLLGYAWVAKGCTVGF